MPTTPPTYDPTLVRQSSVVFSYPYTNPTLSVTLTHAPDMGNTEQVKYSRVNVDSRGGDPIIFADPNWPMEQVQTLNFSYIKQTEINDFQSFLQQTLGQQIKYTDHENQTWKLVILNPNTPITNMAKTDACGNDLYSFSLEVQGAMTSWP